MKQLMLIFALAAGLASGVFAQGAQGAGVANGPAGAAMRRNNTAGSGPNCQSNCSRKGSGQCDGSGPKRSGGGMQCGRQGRCGRR
ncbi:MAG: hypothetical protein HY821_25755 [Acidobacteria bacterium]|nr:hypothetical protein [Acidobacteriota bacterium]